MALMMINLFDMHCCPSILFSSHCCGSPYLVYLYTNLTASQYLIYVVKRLVKLWKGVSKKIVT